MKLKEIKRLLLENKKELREKYGIKEMGIFGSYVREEETELSDVDILVEFEKPIEWEFVDLWEELQKILGIKVDVLTKEAVMRNLFCGIQ